MTKTININISRMIGNVIIITTPENLDAEIIQKLTSKITEALTNLREDVEQVSQGQEDEGFVKDTLEPK